MGKANKQDHVRRAQGKFEPGGDLGSIEDRNEYERRLNAVPPNEKKLAEESTRMADLCQYFSDQKMAVPPQVLEQLGGLSRLAIKERVQALKDINQALMEYLNDVGQNPGIRQ